MNKRKPLDILLLIFKIVIPCFLVLVLTFFSVDLYDQKLTDLAKLNPVNSAPISQITARWAGKKR